VNFPLYIARRYLLSRSRQNAVNVINMITFSVIVVGSAALFIVLSAFSGLKDFSLQYTNTLDPDLKIRPAEGKFFSYSPEIEGKLEAVNGIHQYSKEIEERVYLSFRQKSHIASIRGVDSSFRAVTGIDSALYYGSWGIENRHAVLGAGMANLLQVPVNNYQTPLTVMAPKPGKGPLGADALGSSAPYNTIGLVASGVYSLQEDLDKKYLFTSLPLVQALLEKDSTQLSAISIKLQPKASREAVRLELRKVFGPGFAILTREELNSTLHKMLNTENLATYLIFTLVLIIALFNVAGAIIMLIIDKKEHSKTLYNLGATLRQLRWIYFYQGVLLTGLGGLMGVVIGALIVATQIRFQWLKITQTLAYPVELRGENVLVVLATIFVLGFIAAMISSRQVKRRLLFGPRARYDLG